MTRRPLPALRAGQSGAIAVIAAVTLVVAVLVTALVVDIGRLVFDRQKLQGVADAAALAGATELARQGDQAAVTAAAQMAALQNGYEGDLGAEAEAVALGHMISEEGIRGFAPGAPLNAVQVTATKTLPRSLIAGGLLPGDVTLTARAVAHQESVAGLQVGSFLLGVDSERSAVLNVLLSGLLGGSVKLDAVAYSGMINAFVSLQALIEADGRVGTVQELLDLDLSLAEALQIMAQALQNQGDAAAVYVNQLALVTNPALNLSLGELLFVERGAEAALEAMLNVFDLVMAMAQVANQGHAVELDFAGSGLLSALGLANLDVTLWLIEPPRIAIGPPGRDADTGEWLTWAENGQVSLDVRLETLSINIGLIATRVNLDMFVDAARADAALAAVTRATPSDPFDRAEVEATTKIARIGIGRRVNGTMSPSILVDVHERELGITVTRLYATALADVTVGDPLAQPVHFTGPFVPAIDTPSPGNTQRIGTDADAALNQAIANLLADLEIYVDANLIGIGLSVEEVRLLLLGVVTDVVNGVVPQVLAPLLKALGTDLGGADITIFYLDAGEPRLIQ